MILKEPKKKVSSLENIKVPCCNRLDVWSTGSGADLKERDLNLWKRKEFKYHYQSGGCVCPLVKSSPHPSHVNIQISKINPYLGRLFKKIIVIGRIL